MSVNVKDGWIGLAPANGAHDRMSDGVIAAEANQRIAGVHNLSDPLLDEIPWVRGAIEL